MRLCWEHSLLAIRGMVGGEEGCLHGKDLCGRECVFEVGVCVMGIGMFMWACTPICGVFFPFFLGSGCVQNRIQNAPFLAL